MVAAQVGGLAAGAAGQAGQAEPGGQLGRHAAGGHEAVLQPGVLVVDLAQRAHLAFDRVALAAHARRACAGGRSTATPPGTTASIMKRWPKASLGQALPVFAQARELRQAEGQRRIVAQGAEVAQVVGHALALEHQRAQPRARARASRSRQADSSAMQ